MISKFICEVCGWQYNNADSATTCETQHKTIEKAQERKRIEKMLEAVDDEMERFEDTYEECFFADCEKCDGCTFFDEDDFCDCDCENRDDCEEVAESENFEETLLNKIQEPKTSQEDSKFSLSLSYYKGKHYKNGNEIEKEEYDELMKQYFSDWC
jgi:hypothetical protein